MGGGCFPCFSVKTPEMPTLPKPPQCVQEAASKAKHALEDAEDFVVDNATAAAHTMEQGLHHFEEMNKHDKAAVVGAGAALIAVGAGMAYKRAQANSERAQ